MSKAPIIEYQHIGAPTAGRFERKLRSEAAKGWRLHSWHITLHHDGDIAYDGILEREASEHYPPAPEADPMPSTPPFIRRGL